MFLGLKMDLYFNLFSKLKGETVNAYEHGVGACNLYSFNG